MNWNAFPKSYNLEEIGIRRQNLAHKPLISGPDQLSMPQIRRSKVIINPVKESNYRRQYQKNIPKVSGRAAKIDANSKIFGINLFGNDRRSRSVEFKKKNSNHGAKFVAIKPKNKPKNTHQAYYPPVPSVPKPKNTLQTTTSPSPTSDSDSPSPKPRPRVSLKNFSIPLVPVKVHFVRFSTPPSTASISPSPPPESVSSDTSNHSAFTSSGSSYSNISSVSNISDTPYVIVVD